jgi:hypothetical protein
MAEAPEEDKIGPGHPPKHTRWKEGQSGNPRGRPKKQKALKDLANAELDKKITVREDGRPIEITTREALMKVLIKKCLGGHNPSIKQLMYILGTDSQDEPSRNVNFVFEG